MMKKFPTDLTVLSEEEFRALGKSLTKKKRSKEFIPRCTSFMRELRRREYLKEGLSKVAISCLDRLRNQIKERMEERKLEYEDLAKVVGDCYYGIFNAVDGGLDISLILRLATILELPIPPILQKRPKEITEVAKKKDRSHLKPEIQEARNTLRRKGWTQLEVADALGISKCHVNFVLNGKRMSHRVLNFISQLHDNPNPA